MIANNSGLSRASLYRLFEPVGGIASYIRKARLQHAYQHITMSELSDRRIGQIAHGLGFKNITTFNRMFHKLYGLNPSEARRKSAHDQPSIILRTSADSKRTLAECLRRLGQP